MTFEFQWTDDGSAQSPFLRHTPYLPLDTVKFNRAIEWNGELYSPKRRPAYIIGRDLPGKLVRELFKNGLARPGPKLWENQEPFAYVVEDKAIPVAEIHIKAFSLTNFYSIPRFFQRLYTPVDIGHKAAHLHDVLCDDKPVRFNNRVGECYDAVHPVNYREAAQIFFEAQQVALVPERAAWWKYQAVSWFGPRFEAQGWIRNHTP